MNRPPPSASKTVIAMTSPTPIATFAPTRLAAPTLRNLLKPEEGWSIEPTIEALRFTST